MFSLRRLGFIPNIFTPNGDGANQFFQVADELLGSRLAVYNGWGKVVFESKGYDNNWNGNGLPAGVYFYRLEGSCIEPRKGWLAIIY
jgi:gliding motility-associated-like protein